MDSLTRAYHNLKYTLPFGRTYRINMCTGCGTSLNIDNVNWYDSFVCKKCVPNRYDTLAEHLQNKKCEICKIKLVPGNVHEYCSYAHCGVCAYISRSNGVEGYHIGPDCSLFHTDTYGESLKLNVRSPTFRSLKRSTSTGMILGQMDWNDWKDKRMEPYQTKKWYDKKTSTVY